MGNNSVRFVNIAIADGFVDYQRTLALRVVDDDAQVGDGRLNRGF